MAEGKKRVLLGVGGGIAAYKVVELASLMTKHGLDVSVVMSQSAQEFIQPLTFEVVTGNSVSLSVFPNKNSAKEIEMFPHLFPSSEVDLFILAPGTANLIAKIRMGLGDDIVSSSILGLNPSAVRMIVPAMNGNMWNHPAVQDNMAYLKSMGWHQVGPAYGRFACGGEGFGRMAEPQEIFSKSCELLAQESLLKGKKILILSGPTREHIDSVRFISNCSTGRMGKKLAERAQDYGAEVIFISGPVEAENLPKGPNIKLIKVVSTEEMHKRAEHLMREVDGAIFCAAVCDFKPEVVVDGKLKKEDLGKTVSLVENIDIAKSLSSRKKAEQVTIGFALESADELENGTRKLQAKALDGIVVNTLDSIGSDKGRFSFLSPGVQGEEIEKEFWGDLAKSECAEKILQFMGHKLKK